MVGQCNKFNYTGNHHQQDSFVDNTQKNLVQLPAKTDKSALNQIDYEFDWMANEKNSYSLMMLTHAGGGGLDWTGHGFAGNGPVKLSQSFRCLLLHNLTL